MLLFAVCPYIAELTGHILIYYKTIFCFILVILILLTIQLKQAQAVQEM